MPNRRRRKLSTAMSAVAALAVASPVAVVAVTELSGEYEARTPAPRVRPGLPDHRPAQRAVVGAVAGAVAVRHQRAPDAEPADRFRLVDACDADAGAAPPLTAHRASPPPRRARPHRVPPCRAPPHAALTGTDLTNPALTNPPPPNPALTSPTGETPGLTTAPTGHRPGAHADLHRRPAGPHRGADLGTDRAGRHLPDHGGDPSLAAMPASTDGGLIGDLSSAAEQLGAGQAIDLLKGMVMPRSCRPSSPRPRRPPRRRRRRRKSCCTRRHRRSRLQALRCRCRTFGRPSCRVETLVTTDTYVTSVPCCAVAPRRRSCSPRSRRPS